VEEVVEAEEAEGVAPRGIAPSAFGFFTPLLMELRSTSPHQRPALRSFPSRCLREQRDIVLFHRELKRSL
jgi:hypothetical protein